MRLRNWLLSGTATGRKTRVALSPAAKTGLIDASLYVASIDANGKTQSRHIVEIGTGTTLVPDDPKRIGLVTRLDLYDAGNAESEFYDGAADKWVPLSWHSLRLRTERER